MKLQDLYEQVQWAVGPNVEHASRISQHEQNRDELIWVDIEKLLRQVDENFYVDPDTNKGEIKGRIPRAKQHWADKGFMDPSSINYNERTDTFGFTDGRHRLVAAYQMGERKAPVVIPSKYVDVAKQRLS